MTSTAVVSVDGLDQLFDELRSRGYVVIGPTPRDGAIVLDEVHSWRDLPAGLTDEQDAGQYRLRRRDDEALLGFSNGPQSWKRLLFPPRERVARVDLRTGEADRMEDPADQPGYAFFGVHACDLAAIAIQDRVFREGAHPDPGYDARRRKTFVIAVQCTDPGGTCFCASMNTGPRATAGFDLAVTEVLTPDHRFVIEAGSDAGEAVLGVLGGRPATPGDLSEAHDLVDGAAARMGRALDTGDLPGLLTGRPEHPRWDDVADRCLSCANCTMVCPTCFCSTVEEVNDLAGDHTERWRRWDSCFSLDFSYLGGGHVRSSTRSRYRQWLTHKLDTWHEQFGTSGCVGCGRCIAWCPVGIDLTEEVPALRLDGTDR